MKALVLAAALALAGQDGPPPSPPFPAPRLVAPTPDLKCDWGPLLDVKPGVITVKTDAGPFEAKVDARARVSGADGRVLRGSVDLQLGQKVRVYYRVENKVGGGAIAQEVDLY